MHRFVFVQSFFVNCQRSSLAEQVSVIQFCDDKSTVVIVFVVVVVVVVVQVNLSESICHINHYNQNKEKGRLFPF